MDKIKSISAEELSPCINEDKILLVDSRTFCEFNTSHIYHAISVWSSKIRKKRLQQSSVSVLDFMKQATQVALHDDCNPEVIVYDQNSKAATSVSQDSFLYVLLHKLLDKFTSVKLLEGGFLDFEAKFPDLCEDTSSKMSPLTSLSQPCLPLANTAFTRILPFLFLGSQKDANNKDLLKECNITYELNVSATCPKPTFLSDSHFFRISVNDNFNEKLLPHFQDAFDFIDKVRASGERVLVHCLAGISRSPTVAIAYVMRHLKLHYDEAYRYVKQRRPTISPNINFVGQLLELDRIMYGDNSVCRSPTIPIDLDQEFPFDVLPCPDSLVRKSSSSPCIDSAHAQSFPKRSLPFLGASRDPMPVRDRLPSSPTTPHSEILEALNTIPIRVEYMSDDVAQETALEVPQGYEVGPHRKTGNVVNPSVLYNVKISEADGTPRDKNPEPADAIESSFKPSTKSRKTENRVDGPVVTQKPPIPPDEYSSHAPDGQPTSAIPPAVPKPPARPSKKAEKQFPRAHSSSETHIPTKRLLEASSSLDKEPAGTRKSMSTDEVSRGYSTTPQSPLVFSRENSLPVGSSELARCDSWSTSGLGSEISDWESVQGENAPALTEDTQGPYEAVFSDIYPGDSTECLYKERKSSGTPERPVKPYRSASDHRVSRGAKTRGHRPLTHSSSMKGPLPPRALSRSSSAPRPVSLPGVTDSYNAQVKSSSIDMGVDLDDSPGWSSEKLSDFEFEKRSPKPTETEHPAVSPRTMGDDVKHFMTWFKIDAWQGKDQDAVKSESPNFAGYELQKFSRFDSKRHTYYSGQKFDMSSAVDADPPTGSWQWWDSQLKRKVQSIERNAQTWTRASNIDLLSTNRYPQKLAGYHLTEELMHSVEHLLETEMGDIKRQASTLKSRYGLEKPEDHPADERKLSTVSFSNEETVSNSSESSARTAILDRSRGLISADREKSRAMSEPPLCAEEGLYRVRSCPGLPQDQEANRRQLTIGPGPVIFRSPRPPPSNKEPNRYSCGALDSLPSNMPSFESCPDVSKLKRYFLENNSASSSTTCSSQSSFSRLLQVS